MKAKCLLGIGLLLLLAGWALPNGPTPSMSYEPPTLPVAIEEQLKPLTYEEGEALLATCPLYVISMSGENSSLYHDSGLHPDRRDKGVIPPNIKLCVIGKFRAGNPDYPDAMSWTYQVTFNGKEGWYSGWVIKDRKLYRSGDRTKEAEEHIATRAKVEEQSMARRVKQRTDALYPKCLRAARNVATVPNSISIKRWWSDAWIGHRGGVIGKGILSGQNAFGIPVERSLECTINEKGIFDITIY